MLLPWDPCLPFWDLLWDGSDGCGASVCWRWGRDNPRQMALVALIKVRRAESSGWLSLPLAFSAPGFVTTHPVGCPSSPGIRRLCLLSLGNALVPGRLGVGSCKQPSPGTPACRALNHQHGEHSSRCRFTHPRRTLQKGSAILHPFHPDQHPLDIELASSRGVGLVHE